MRIKLGRTSNQLARVSKYYMGFLNSLMTHEGNTREVHIYYLINICKSHKDFFYKIRQTKQTYKTLQNVHTIQAGNDHRDSL